VVEQGDVLWEPADDARAQTRMGAFLTAAEQAAGRTFADQEALWRWSVEEIDEFWTLFAEFIGVVWHDRPEVLLADDAMPGAVWAPGGTLNYAEHCLRGGSLATGTTGTTGKTGDTGPDDVAILHTSQTRAGGRLTWDELREQVARVRAGLVRLGVARGDRVAAYLPDVPETLVAFLATASLGAVWTSCAPEFGVDAVVDRFSVVEPSVLLVVDGYRYGARDVDRAEEVAAIRAGLPSLEHTVLLPYLDPAATLPDVTAWEELTAESAPLAFEPVPFDHPLYVLYSSGTTGRPKAIVHGHGGILLEHCKVLALHHDLGPGDRFLWFTTTGWMMWNYKVSCLAVGTALVCFDGDPAFPGVEALWRYAAESGVTMLGLSPGFIAACERDGLVPRERFDMSALRQVGVAGSPLPPHGFAWVTGTAGDHVQCVSASGGTDVCSAFVGGSPLLPVWAGEMSCRALGCAVEAWDPDGHPIVGRRGELVITRPMPSMPVGFWGDTDGSRYRASYFEHYPGVWRHGDWITITDRGSCIISGRSDATLNRGGVRMGTADFYTVVEALDEVVDALVVHLESADGPGRLLLFVHLVDGIALDDDLRRTVASTCRDRLSPRHVPDELHAVPAIPRTLSGKKLEVPVKRLLQGEAVQDVASEGSLADPAALQAFVRLVAQRQEA
jgi:acetoacetyl-CoA synthetase